MESHGEANEAISDQTTTSKRSLISVLKITVEPIFFALFFCGALTDAAGANLLLTRACTMVFHFSKKNCSGEIAPAVNDIIQPYTANILLIRSLADSTITVVLSLFIGSWSDSIGRRKPFIVLPLIGTAIKQFIWLTFIYLEVKPIYFVFATLPYALAGGDVGIFGCGFSYLSDVTNENNRAFRMSIATVSLTMGIFTGYLVSNEIIKNIHSGIYITLYGISLGVHILILVYTMFILPESLPQENKNQEARRNEKSFFDISHIKQSIAVLFQRRPSNGRLVMLLLTIIIVMDIVLFNGESNIKYLIFKASVAWSVEDYNIFSAILSGTAGVVGLGGLWLLNTVLGLNESFIILLASVLCTLSTVLLAISKNTLDIYCAAILGCLIMLVSPLVKTKISHLVPNSDIGKVFAFISTLEAIAPFAASPIYTYVYDMVISYKPLYVEFVSVGIWSFTSILALLIVIIDVMNARNYQQLEETVEENEINADHGPIPA